MLLCSPIYRNMISSHYSNGDPSPPTANQSLLRLKLFCLKRKNPEASPVNCKKKPDRAMKQQQPSSEIHQNPKSIKQSECHIRNSMALPKKSGLFLSSSGCHILGCNIQLRMFWREAPLGPKGSSSPWATCWGVNLGAWSVWNLERCCQALWTSADGWNLVKYGQYWLVMVSNG